MIWDLKSLKAIFRFHDAESPFCRVSFSPDGKKIATSEEGKDRQMKVWDFETKKMEISVDSFTGGGLVFSPDGKWLACSGAGDGSGLMLWDTSDYRKPAYRVRYQAEKDGSWEYVSAITFSRDSRLLTWAHHKSTYDAAGKYTPGKTRVTIRDLKSGTLRSISTGQVDSVQSMKFDRENRLIALCGYNGAVSLVDATDGGKAPTVLKSYKARGVEFSNDNKSLIVSGFEPKGKSKGDGATIEVWDVESKKLQKTLTAHNLPIRDFHLSRDNATLITASEGTVKIWRLPKGWIGRAEK